MKGSEVLSRSGPAARPDRERPLTSDSGGGMGGAWPDVAAERTRNPDVAV